MSDVKAYIKKRAARDAEFADGFEAGYANFKVGVMLRQAREAKGLTQADIAARLGTQRATISKIENRADDVRLVMLKRYAKVMGWNLQMSLVRG
jgi:DNA-binding XRE family transcriptional regulator